MTARYPALCVGIILFAAHAVAPALERAPATGGRARGNRAAAMRPGDNSPGTPRPGGGGGAPATAATEPAVEPEVRMEHAEDVVILTDGTKISCTIVAAGQRRLLIVRQGEKTETAIDRSTVESYRRGAGEGRIVTYSVEADTDKGVLVLKEKDTADPSTFGATDGAEGPAVIPAQGNAPAAPGAELGGLWKLLQSRPGAPEIAQAFRDNPSWAGSVAQLVREGKVPADGLAAVAAFRSRLRTDAELRNGLAELAAAGKLPADVLAVLKGD